MFSVLTWAYPLLPDIGVTWSAEWPQDFDALPRASFRLADDSTGVVIDRGEGSARVGLYVDTWHATPEEREVARNKISQVFIGAGMSRVMTRQVGELRPDGQMAYRQTILFSGEYDHGTGRMCRP